MNAQVKKATVGVTVFTLMGVTLGACQSGEKPQAVSASPVSPVSPVAPTPSATTEVEHKLGVLIHHSDGEASLDVKVLQYRRIKDESPRGAVEVKSCSKSSKPFKISSAPFSLLYDDGNVASIQISGTSGDYPSFMTGGRMLKPGKCIRGWIHFELINGKNPDSVEYAPGEVEAGVSYVWRIK